MLSILKDDGSHANVLIAGNPDTAGQLGNHMQVADGRVLAIQSDAIGRKAQFANPSALEGRCQLPM